MNGMKGIGRFYTATNAYPGFPKGAIVQTREQGGKSMNSNSTSRMPMLAGVGLALAAILLLLPAHGHAATLNVTDDAHVKGTSSKNFGNKQKLKVNDVNDRRAYAKFDLSVLGGAVGADSGAQD